MLAQTLDVLNSCGCLRDSLVGNVFACLFWSGFESRHKHTLFCGLVRLTKCLTAIFDIELETERCLQLISAEHWH